MWVSGGGRRRGWGAGLLGLGIWGSEGGDEVRGEEKRRGMVHRGFGLEVNEHLDQEERAPRVYPVYDALWGQAPKPPASLRSKLLRTNS